MVTVTNTIITRSWFTVYINLLTCTKLFYLSGLMCMMYNELQILDFKIMHLVSEQKIISVNIFDDPLGKSYK